MLPPTSQRDTHLSSSNPSKDANQLTFAHGQINALEGGLNTVFGPLELCVPDRQDFVANGQRAFFDPLHGILLELLCAQKVGKAFNRDNGFDDVGRHLTELHTDKGHKRLDATGRILLTMARGNWRSMKSEMEGKMISAVRGLVENTEAVAKELNATITVAQSEERGDYKESESTYREHHPRESCSWPWRCQFFGAT